ncbi:MAG: MMPL family transporter [Wenzhouxiangellaceae bacterium]
MTEHVPGIFARLVGRWLLWVVHRPWWVTFAIVFLAMASLGYARFNLGVNTDPLTMLDESLPFRQQFDQYREAFPQQSRTLLLVVQAPTPEQAQIGAAAVTNALRQQSAHFESIHWPRGDEFFLRNGLLFRSTSELNKMADRLSAAQPLLARVQADPSVAGLFNTLAEVTERAEQGAAATTGFDLTAVYRGIAQSLNRQSGEEPLMLSWQQLMSEDGGSGHFKQQSLPSYRELIVVQPHLDYSKVRAGREAIEAVREIRHQLGFDQGAVRLWISGSVALADEELVSVLDGAKIAGLLAVILVTLVLFIGLRSLRQSAIAMLAVFFGLAITIGVAAWAVGRINLISIAFTVLYVGLGVNYAIHYQLRYREMLAAGQPVYQAISMAGVRLLGALVLSAITTAIGFAAFIPTAYTGIAELGQIAAWSMLVTLIISYTLLPALLALAPAPRYLGPASAGKGWRNWLTRYPAAVLWSVAVLAMASALVVSQVRFDSDPLNLRDPNAESVWVLRHMLNVGDSGIRNIQVLVDDAMEARQLADDLQRLPEVDRVISLFDFEPAEQVEKLAVIEDLNWLLGPQLLNEAMQIQVPEPAVQERAVKRLINALDSATNQAAPPLKTALQQLLEREQAKPPGEAYVQVSQSLLRLLPWMLSRLAVAISADQALTMESLPEDFRRQWLSDEGDYLLQVVPLTESVELDSLEPFVEEVQLLAPQATGMPIIQLASGSAVSQAFQKALLWAICGILLVLLVVLRSFWLSTKVLTPLLLGGLFSAALMVLIGIPFNFANVVALPLLLGVGVDNGIHLVMRHRAGGLPAGNVLQTATASGIVLAALTTILSFGNLAFSPHAGTASLGLVLAIGLAFMVITTLVVLPTILPRADHQE